MMKELEDSTAEDINMRARLLENEIRVLRDESNRLALDLQGDKERVKENMEKIKMNKQLPYLVGNVVEILDLKPEARRPASRVRRAASSRFRLPPRRASDLTFRLPISPPARSLASLSGGRRGRRRERGLRRGEAGQGGGVEDDDAADDLPSRHRARRRRRVAIARSFGRSINLTLVPIRPRSRCELHSLRIFSPDRSALSFPRARSLASRRLI